jgi:hypothetical protein
MMVNRDPERGARCLIREVGQPTRDGDEIEYAAEISHRHEKRMAVPGLSEGLHPGLKIARAACRAHAFEDGFKAGFGRSGQQIRHGSRVTPHKAPEEGRAFRDARKQGPGRLLPVKEGGERTSLLLSQHIRKAGGAGLSVFRGRDKAGEQ